MGSRYCSNGLLLIAKAVIGVYSSLLFFADADLSKDIVKTGSDKHIARGFLSVSIILLLGKGYL